MRSRLSHNVGKYLQRNSVFNRNKICSHCVFHHHQKNDADKKAVTDLKDLQKEVERSAEECQRLREKLAKTEAELQSTVEE